METFEDLLRGEFIFNAALSVELNKVAEKLIEMHTKALQTELTNWKNNCETWHKTANIHLGRINALDKKIESLQTQLTQVKSEFKELSEWVESLSNLPDSYPIAAIKLSAKVFSTPNPNKRRVADGT